MRFELLPPTSILRIESYAHYDTYVSQSMGFGSSLILPDNIRDFQTSRGLVVLPECAIRTIISFPRILDVQNNTEDLIVTLPAAASRGLTVNGTAFDKNTFCFIGPNAGYKAVERTFGRYYSLLFRKSLDPRGWPEPCGPAKLCLGSVQAMNRLRRTVVAIIQEASDFHNADLVPKLLNGMQDALLRAMDFVFASSQSIARSLPMIHLKLARKLDDFLSNATSEPIYSAPLAKELGVSIRGLHTAIYNVRGTSVHRYIRRKRLWNVRTQLLTAHPSEKVKTISVRNGFWHQGEFSSAYYAAFRELPSETLMRANQKG